jgi:hypothetical protein
MHDCAVALHDMHYNLCRVHQTLRVTPAIETRITSHVWIIKEGVNLSDSEAHRLATSAGDDERMSWNAIVDRVAPYVVKIETPRGHGTGFLCFYNQTRTFIGIATARHVVSYADEWQQPIRLQHFPSSTTVFLKESDRTILSDVDTDSAVILTQPGELQLPENPRAGHC